MSCCSKKKVANVQTSHAVGISKQDSDKLYYDFLAPSVYHVSRVFCQCVDPSFIYMANAKFIRFFLSSWTTFQLQTILLDDIKSAGLDENTCTIYDIEDLRDGAELGVIRRKGANTICPIDGKLGAAYVHSIGKENSTIKIEDHCGSANYMLSYAWG